MLSPQFHLDLHREITVDLFAGGGGASTGIERRRSRGAKRSRGLNSLAATPGKELKKWDSKPTM